MKWIRGVLLALAAAGGAFAANAQVDATYRIVAHYDTAPTTVAAPAGTRGSALDVLRTYARASAAEGGFVSIKVLIDTGRASRFEVLEIWATQDAYTAHKTAAAYTALQTSIAPWLVGPVEEIPHNHFK